MSGNGNRDTDSDDVLAHAAHEEREEFPRLREACDRARDLIRGALGR